MKNKKVLFLVQFSILTAIEAIFCFTPLGSLPAIGPIVATLMMIPVIITAILLGTKAGTAMGFIAGLFSFLVWTFMTPSPLVAFIFTPFYSLGEFQGNIGSLIICFIPRILSGTVAGALYKAIAKLKPEKHILSMIISSALGSLTNTFGVMFGIWLFFGSQYSSIAGEAMLAVIGTTVLTSGLPEAAVAAILCPAVSKSVMVLKKRRG
jgi:uncharacterized membrane protein